MIYPLLWLCWVLAFVMLEGRALARSRTDETFSWQVWALERTLPVTRWLIAAGLGWLIVHFLFHA